MARLRPRTLAAHVLSRTRTTLHAQFLATTCGLVAFCGTGCGSGDTEPEVDQSPAPGVMPAGADAPAPVMREWFRPDEPVRSLTTSAPPYFPIAEPHESPYCTLPSTANWADAVDAYELWKAELLTEEGAAGHLRVVRPDTPDGLPNSTVSEGISYGMILAAYFDDQDTFDQLWLYSQAFANDHGLMNWYIDPTGTIACPGEEDECGAATDADEDIAWALLMADRQWGGGAEREPGGDYIDLAIAQIDRVLRWEVEFNTNVVRPGDRWGGSATTNPSYFAPAYYRVFAAVTGDDQWLEVAEVSYDLLEASLNAENGNQDNGLVPAWMNAAGTPVKAWDDEVSADGTVVEAPLHHQYDSARMPFRIAQDYCYFGAPRAKAYLDKVNAFFDGVGPLNITDGYDLDGTPRPEASQEGSDSAVFVAAAGVAAMADAERDAFRTAAYQRLTQHEAILVRSEYYQRSWTALGLLMMNGLFFDLTQYERP